MTLPLVRSGRRIARDRAGMVLPMVIFALVIMLIVSVVAMHTGTDMRRSARSTREGNLALMVAESGLRQTLGNWPSGVAALAAGDSLDLGWQSLPNRARYRTVIRRVDGGTLQSYNVVTQGRGVSGLAGQSTVTTTVVGVPLLTYGLFAEGNITFSSSGASLDGFDSEVAPYDAATADSTGSMATNANIALHTAAVVLGDLTAGGTITSGPNVTGTVTPLHTPAFPAQPITACPSTGYTPMSSMTPLPSGATYNATTGVLSLAAGANLVLTGSPSQYYFSQLLMSGSATITVSSTSHVDILVSDLVTLGGNGISNTSGSAPRLTISSCGSPAVPATWTIAGGANAYFAVYAPNHPVTLSGNGDLFGAIVARTITSSGGAHVHYDMALSRLPSRNLVVLPGSWAQLP